MISTDLFKEQIVIQRGTVTNNGGVLSVGNYSTLVTLNGRFSSPSETDVQRFSQTDFVLTAIIYCETTTETIDKQTDRILYDGQAYNILGVDMPKEIGGTTAYMKIAIGKPQ